MEGPKSGDIRPIDLEKVTCCILKSLDNSILRWRSKNRIDESFFSELTNNVANKTVPIDIATENNAFTCKRFYAKELYKNSSKDTYSKINSLSVNVIINKNIRDLITKFGILPTSLLKIIDCIICTGCLR